MPNTQSFPRRRQAYPSDVSDDERAFVALYLTLLAEDAGQRRYPLREVFNGLRYVVLTGCPWRMLLHDLPPWPIVYQQARRWLAAGCFEALLHDVRLLLRLAKDCGGLPTAAIFDSRTVQSTPESGARAGYDGYKRRKGSKVHAAVDTLGDLLTLVVMPANEQDRAQVATLAAAVQDVTGDTVEVAFVDQGYTGPATEDAATAHGIQLVVVKLPDADGPKRGFVLLPRRWVVERTFAWTSRFRHLARDYERLARVLAGWHLVAITCLLLHQLLPLISSP